MKRSKYYLAVISFFISLRSSLGNLILYWINSLHFSIFIKRFDIFRYKWIFTLKQLLSHSSKCCKFTVKNIATHVNRKYKNVGSHKGRMKIESDDRARALTDIRTSHLGPGQKNAKSIVKLWAGIIQAEFLSRVCVLKI